MRFWSVVRVAVAGLLAARLVVEAQRHQALIRYWLERLRPPLRTEASAAGDDILQRHELTLQRDVAETFADTKKQLDAARSRGVDVSQLDALLPQAIHLAEIRQYDEALTLLNRIVVSIPKPPEPVVAARSDDPLPAEPALKTRAVRRRRRPRSRG